MGFFIYKKNCDLTNHTKQLKKKIKSIIFYLCKDDFLFLNCCFMLNNDDDDDDEDAEQNNSAHLLVFLFFLVNSVKCYMSITFYWHNFFIMLLLCLSL